MKQDFKTGFTKIKSLLRKKGMFDFRELKGSHANFSLLISIPLSTLIILNVLALLSKPHSILILSLLILIEIFTLLNLSYFHFMARIKHSLFMINAFIISLIDNLVIQLGILFGFVDYLLGRKY